MATAVPVFEPSLLADLTFDADGHVYRFQGASVPSVTGLLSQVPPRLGMLERARRANPQALERKRQIGTAVHVAAHYHDEGSLDPTTVDPQARPYLDAWLRFRHDTGFVPTRLETRVYHPIFGYAGTLDRLGAFDNADLALLDIKCGDIVGSDLQLSAYDAAFRVVHDIDVPLPRYAIQLFEDGRYKVHPYRNRRDFRVFLACIELCGYLERA